MKARIEFRGVNRKTNRSLYRLERTLDESLNATIVASLAIC
jgi:hypothetical protein